MKTKEIWSILKQTVTRWDDDQAVRFAAALACYALLSLAPLLVIAVAITGLVFGQDAARGQIANEMGSVVGPEAAQAVQAVVANAKGPSSSFLGTLLGVFVLFLGASGVFGELQWALNTVWSVKARPEPGIFGIWRAVKRRFISFTMVVVVACLLLISLVVSAVLSAVGNFFESALPGGTTLWQALNFCISLGVGTLLFALIFKVVPEAQILWRDVWVGAFATALMFTLGKLALGLYLGTSAVASSYGAASSVVLLVLWVYYSAQILFLGAEFTRVCAERARKGSLPWADEK